MFAIYGASNKFIDVTKLVQRYYVTDNVLWISSGMKRFNALFTDPISGTLKYLIIGNQGETFAIGEYDLSEYSLNLDTKELIVNTYDAHDGTVDYVETVYKEHFSDTQQYRNVCFLHSCNMRSTFVLESTVKKIIEAPLIEILDAIWIVNVGKKYKYNFRSSQN